MPKLQINKSKAFNLALVSENQSLVKTVFVFHCLIFSAFSHLLLISVSFEAGVKFGFLLKSIETDTSREVSLRKKELESFQSIIHTTLS